MSTFGFPVVLLHQCHYILHNLISHRCCHGNFPWSCGVLGFRNPEFFLRCQVISLTPTPHLEGQGFSVGGFPSRSRRFQLSEGAAWSLASRHCYLATMYYQGHQRGGVACDLLAEPLWDSGLFLVFNEKSLVTLAIPTETTTSIWPSVLLYVTFNSFYYIVKRKILWFMPYLPWYSDMIFFITLRVLMPHLT
jgi:hypothetical protein